MLCFWAARSGGRAIGRLVLLLVLSVSSLARAEAGDAATRSAARKIAQDGVAALQRGDYEQATIKLEKAYEVLRVPSLALWSARALVKKGLLVEASERYREASRLGVQQGEKTIQVQARKDALSELDELTPRIPTLLIAVEGAAAADVKLTLDGALLPPGLVGEERPVNPGEHRVLGELGEERHEQNVTLAEAEQRAVTLRFTPMPKAAPKIAAVTLTPTVAEPENSSRGTRRALSYVVLGLGGAALIAGGVTGGLVLKQRADFDDSQDCRKNECLPSKQGDVKRFNALRMISTIGFVAGGVLVAGGSTLFFTAGAPSSDAAGPERASLSLSLGAGSAALSGTF